MIDCHFHLEITYISIKLLILSISECFESDTVCADYENTQDYMFKQTVVSEAWFTILQIRLSCKLKL